MTVDGFLSGELGSVVSDEFVNLESLTIIELLEAVPDALQVELYELLGRCSERLALDRENNGWD